VCAAAMSERGTKKVQCVVQPFVKEWREQKVLGQRNSVEHEWGSEKRGRMRKRKNASECKCRAK